MTPRSAESDRQALTALETEWLGAHDAATLDRILAPDFVHPVAAGVFLTKAEHIDWATKHLPPPGRTLRFERMDVRLYGDVAIVNGTVVASDAQGREVERSVFTDVFAYRERRWRAVNAQENRVVAQQTVTLKSPIPSRVAPRWSPGPLLRAP
jgi:hypothetical protein